MWHFPVTFFTTTSLKVGTSMCQEQWDQQIVLASADDHFIKRLVEVVVEHWPNWSDSLQMTIGWNWPNACSGQCYWLRLSIIWIETIGHSKPCYKRPGLTGPVCHNWSLHYANANANALDEMNELDDFSNPVKEVMWIWWTLQKLWIGWFDWIWWFGWIWYNKAIWYTTVYRSWLVC